MVEKHRAMLDPAFVINEGGRVMMRGGAVETVSIQSAEKIYNDTKIWIRGESGHSSVPRANNAIYSMARLLARLESHRAPIRINATVAAAYAKQWERERDASAAALMKAVAAGDVKAGEELARRDPKANAALRSTFVPTVIEGGIRENVLPPDVLVNVNIRLLPGEKLDDMIDTLARVAELPPFAKIEVKAGDDWRAALRAWSVDQEEKRRRGAEGVFDAAIVIADRGMDAPASPLENELYRAIEKVAREMSPEAVVTPSMSTGATDSRFWRAKGVPAYGLLPLPATDEDLKGFHDHNERVAVSSVGYGVRMMVRIIEEVCR
jgi:acetylornithine deacetylase/succinyl-diaminopimelate desuccinylase-like protein